MTNAQIKINKEWKDGIRFACQICGGCCGGHDDGEVFIYRDDIERLVQHLGWKGKSALKKFAGKYLKVIKDSFFLKESKTGKGKKYKYHTLAFRFFGENQQCAFLEDNKCTVHTARPFQCRCFPFWQMMVKSVVNVDEYALKCPGLKNINNGDGQFYSPEEILQWAEDEYRLEKDYFLEMKANDFDIFKVYKFLPKDITIG